MAPSVKIFMNAQITAMTVIATLPVPILKDPGHAHVTQVLPVMEHHVLTSMNAQTTAMTAIATLPVPILKDPGHAHAIQVILAMAHPVQI
jgi:hypothetical protein